MSLQVQYHKYSSPATFDMFSFISSPQKLSTSKEVFWLFNRIHCGERMYATLEEKLNIRLSLLKMCRRLIDGGWYHVWISIFAFQKINYRKQFYDLSEPEVLIMWELWFSSYYINNADLNHI